jgi:hypothetical protein
MQTVHQILNYVSWEQTSIQNYLGALGVSEPSRLRCCSMRLLKSSRLMWTGGLNSAQSLRSALTSKNAHRRATPEMSGTFRAHHADEGRNSTGSRTIFRFVIRFSEAGDGNRTRDTLLGKHIAVKLSRAPQYHVLRPYADFSLASTLFMLPNITP